MEKKQIGINLIAGMISCATTLGVSFLLTPYLVAQLGDEAYGYIGLSNQFVTIATVFTTALNSMANRFILLAYQKQDREKVEEYYGSLFAGGLFLAIVFLVAGFVLTYFIEDVFNISPPLVSAVRISFALSIINFTLMTLFSVFTSAAFICNRLDLTSKGEVVANVAKVVFLVAVFTLTRPQIYYVTLGGLLYTAVLYLMHFINTHRLLPEIRLRLRSARIKTIQELVSAGSWNALGSVIQMLMVGMDLMLANWFLDGRAMGLISIANTISVASNSVLVVVTGIFHPVLFRTYATGNMRALQKKVEIASRMQCAIMYVPIAGLIVFGITFYSLWMPYKSREDIFLLVGITIVKVWDQFAGLTTTAMRSNFSMYNRVRQSVVARFGCSLLNLPIVIFLLSICPWYEGDVLIIAGISSVLYCVYYWGMEPGMVARITGVPIGVYYKMIGREIVLFICLVVIYVIGYMIMPEIENWVHFIIVIVCEGMIGYVLTWFIGLNKEDRADMKKIFYGKRT